MFNCISKLKCLIVIHFITQKKTRVINRMFTVGQTKNTN